MKVKICGMKSNIAEVAALQPDYLGFIFYKNSPRNFEGKMPLINNEIKKAGVFVDEKISRINEIINEFQLDIIQLHGNESETFCKEIKLQNPEIELWKSFSVHDEFDFNSIKIYKSIDKILLDTKGKNQGGNGIKFNWQLLENINFEKPFVLSGGIEPEDAALIKNLKIKNPQLETVDLNSRFEIEPGLKDIKKLNYFLQELNENL